jgi:cytidylate kinase
VAEALARAGQHEAINRPAGGPYSPVTPFSIAISRQTGARGTSVARAVGKLLDWHVYDNELLLKVAHEMNLPSSYVAAVDEKPVSWLQECVQALSSATQATEEAFVRHLLETLFLLGAKGECVIVGRGAAHALPASSTLRVRLVAPLEDRIEFMRREMSITRSEAARFVEKTDRERARFIRDHLVKDSEDPANYDLILNASRFSVDECAALIAESLRKMQAR